VTKSTGRDLSVPKLQLSDKNIVVLVLKPSEDGKAWMVTLFNPSDKPGKTGLQWSSPVKAAYYSNT
jgi:alpha-mannosidase